MKDQIGERCLARTFNRSQSNEPDTVAITVGRADGGALIEGSSVEVLLSIRDACRFFAGDALSVEAELPDGTKTNIVQIPDDMLLARSPRGNWVRVRPTYDAIARRRVLILDTCNRMPSPHDHPFERPGTYWKSVVLTDSQVPTIPMHVDKEVLEYECTRYTY